MSKPLAIAPKFLSFANLPLLNDHFSVDFDWEAGIDSVLNAAEIEILLDKFSIIMADLSMIPLKTGSEGWSIVALRGPRRASDLLVIHDTIRCDGMPLSVQRGACISVNTSIQASQLSALAPEITVSIVPETGQQMLAMVEEGTFLGALVPSATCSQELTASGNLLFKPLHPKELIPPPGRGVVALLCRSDEQATRQLLKGLHQPDIALCTNIERTFFACLAPEERADVAAYCMTDQRGYFHLHVYHRGLQVRKSLSYSTSFGLAEAMANEFKQQLSQYVSDL